MSGAINYLLDLVRVPSDVIVLGPDDSPELRKAAWYERLIYFIPQEEKYFVYDTGLRRLMDKVKGLVRNLEREKLNSPEYLTLFKKIDSIKDYLEQAVKPDPTKFSSNTVERIKVLAASILADKLKADKVRIMDELVQAFENKNNEVLLACIEQIKALIEQQPTSMIPLPHLPGMTPGCAEQYLNHLYLVIKTRDYKNHPVSVLYVTLIELSKKGAIAFCEELRNAFPGYLKSLPNIYAKVEALKGIQLPQKTPFQTVDSIPSEIQKIINPLVAEEFDKLLREIVAELKNNPTGFDKKELVLTLEKDFCNYSLSEEDFLAKLAEFCPSLLEELMRCRVEDIKQGLEENRSPRWGFVGYDMCRKIAEKNHLPIPKLSDDDVACLKRLLYKMLASTLGPSKEEYIFLVAEACKWMKELFSISLAPLSQGLFENIKKRFPEEAKYELGLFKQKGTSLSDGKLRLAELIHEFLLTNDQQNELVKMLEAMS